MSHLWRLGPRADRAVLAGVVVVQLISALALQLVVVATLGAGRATDLLVAAQAVPAMVLAILAAPLQNLWHPKLSVVAADRSRWRLGLATALGQCSLLFGGSSLLAAGTAPWWIDLLLPGFSQAERSSIVVLTWMLLASTFLNGHAALYTVGLRSRSMFVLPELVTGLGSITAIVLSVAFVQREDTHTAAAILLFRSAITLVGLWAANQGSLPNPVRGWNIATDWRQLRFIVGGTTVCESIVLVDRYLGSLAIPGGMTAYNLARLGMGSAATVVERTISVPFAPRAAKLIADGQGSDVVPIYNRLHRVATALAAGLLGALLLVEPAWRWIMSASLGMSIEIADIAWWACVLLSGYMLALSANATSVAILFASGDARTMTTVALTSFAIEVALKFAAFSWFGIPGLAAATSLALLVNFLLLRRASLRRLRAETVV